MRPSDRRVKSLSIPEHLLLTVVEQMCGPPASRTLSLPDLGIPPGATVHAVFHRWETCTFEVIVRHPDFPEVPPGDLIPALGGRPVDCHTYFLAPLGSPPVPSATPEFNWPKTAGVNTLTTAGLVDTRKTVRLPEGMAVCLHTNAPDRVQVHEDSP